MRKIAMLAACFLGGWLQVAHGQEIKAPVKNVDLVVCLDTSNSMDGLIQQAKAKLWDIVNEMARVKPAPNLRVALYSYGNTSYDRAAGWVRKDLDLSNDLDLLYEKLFALKTHGGDEYVGRVCHAALSELKWSDDPKALKVIFVCGNESAYQDKLFTASSVANHAKGKHVFINSIYCGNPDDSDARTWREFASLAGGSFASIDQNRAVVASATPFDKELAELGQKLPSTYLFYGAQKAEKEALQREQTTNAAKLSAGAAAAQATFRSSALYSNANFDLVDTLKAKKDLDVAKIPDAELCDVLKKIPADQRKAYVEAKSAERESIQKQIQDISKKRDQFLREEEKRNPNPANRAFDSAVREMLRQQAASQGIVIPKE